MDDSGGFVKRLTRGITAKGTSIAMVEAMGEFAGPNAKNNAIASPSPVIMPTTTPASVVLFQYSP